MSPTPESTEAPGGSFSISFGALNDAALADFRRASAGAPAVGGAASPGPTPENTTLWRREVSSKSASGPSGAGDTRQRNRQAAVRSFGEELLAAFSTAPPPEAPPSAPAASATSAQPAAKTGGIATGLAIDLKRFSQTLRTYHDRISKNTLVETVVDGRTAARTYISISGDLRTVVSGPVDPALAERHAQTLRLAQAQRLAYLKLAALIDEAIVRISVQTALSPILVVPAVYRIVRQVMDELERLEPSPPSF